MNLRNIAFSLALAAGTLSAQNIDKTKNFILLVVPEADTVESTVPAYRLSAGTNPGNSVSINGVPYKVYPSGAFCGKLQLKVGDNPFTITSTSPAGQSVTKQFLVRLRRPLETSRADTLAIEDTLMQPAVNLLLDAGDVLEVQCKGTPGCKASFMNGIAMSELPPSQSSVAGIYRGTYRVRPSDTGMNRRIVFRLEDAFGRTVTRVSNADVSFGSAILPMVGVVRGERPYLNTGLGDDRLGGTKMTFLNPGIRVAITGKIGTMYRVALTDNIAAWIEDRFIDLQPPGTFLPKSLTGNMTVSANGNIDVVTLALDDKLPYATFQELDPTRIVVDVYGATSNTNWITQHSTNEIRNVYYQQVQKDVFRITIELKHRQAWGYELAYEGTTLLVKVRKQPDRLKLKALTIGLDAGHGGENLGAIGSTGEREKNVNLSVVLHLKSLLEDKGARVVLTRSEDVNLTMTERVVKMYKAGVDLVVSVHSNSIGLNSDPAETRGSGTFYKHICFRPLSQCLLNEVLKTGLDTLGNVGSFNFALVGPTEFPAALVETAFISNPLDEMKLLNDDFRKELAERIVDGLKKFLDMCDE